MISQNVTRNKLPRWLIFSLGAIFFSLAHQLIDFYIGLYGETSSTMTQHQALNISLICLLYAWWTASLVTATSNNSRDIQSAFTLSFLWAFLFNGLVGIIAAPPPSAAFPYQDISHFGSMVFGGLACFYIMKKIRENQLVLDRRSVLSTITMILITVGIGGTLALSNL